MSNNNNHNRSEEFAQRLADDLLVYHRVELLNQEARDALIVKVVALVSLAYGIPFMRGEPLDVDEAIEKLRSSLVTLRACFDNRHNTR